MVESFLCYCISISGTYAHSRIVLACIDTQTIRSCDRPVYEFTCRCEGALVRRASHALDNFYDAAFLLRRDDVEFLGKPDALFQEFLSLSVYGYDLGKSSSTRPTD